jgi:hypothetical protein
MTACLPRYTPNDLAEGCSVAIRDKGYGVAEPHYYLARPGRTSGGSPALMPSVQGRRG